MCPPGADSWRSASPPAREAWIEITGGKKAHARLASPPAREAWIEMSSGVTSRQLGRRSPPAREA